MTIFIKDIPSSERPRERLIKYGVSKLSNQELISIVLKTGTKNKSVDDLSKEVLSTIDNISFFKTMPISKLLKINGIKTAKACSLLASIELGKRITIYKENQEKSDFSNPDNIFEYFKDIMNNDSQELFYCLYLDNHKKLLDKKLLFKGTVNKSLIHPREIFKEAYLLSASYIICIHNHPTGEVKPSEEDISATKLIYELSFIHGINLLDHLIIGKDKYYSFYLQKNVIL